MIKIKDIEDLITDEKLDSFFSKRNEELNILTEKEKQRRKKLIGEKKIKFDDVLTAINNIPPQFIETRKTIEERINIYKNQLFTEQSYDNERFYKVGFSDAINFILNGIKQQR